MLSPKLQRKTTNLMSQSDYIHVPYGRTVHGEEEIEAVVNVLRTSTQMGKNVREMVSLNCTTNNMASWSTPDLRPYT